MDGTPALPPGTGGACRISGFGRFPVVEGIERFSEDLAAAARDACLTRGLGRSYGDASLPPGPGRLVANSRRADRILSFDGESGVLRAEAGLGLARLQPLLWRRGFTCPVVPGTQHVTLGGMVAADVHGKNHHVAGTIGAYVRALRLALADGRRLEVDARREPELFAATLGGMGLTAHVLEVELQLERIPSPWIQQASRRAGDLGALLAALREESARWPHTVAWCDALARGRAFGRGIVWMGRWAESRQAPGGLPPPRRRLELPVDLPGWLLGRWSVGACGALRWRRHGDLPGEGLVSPECFFHPLDALGGWNRLYGRRGFVQHQCVLPAAESVAVLLEELVRQGGTSFLAVLKDCGAEGRGLLSFPKPGLSVALDLPQRGNKTEALVDALNEVVLAAGGRIYLAKDSLTAPEHFRAMERERLPAFEAARRRWDPGSRLASALSVRLFGDQP